MYFGEPSSTEPLFMIGASRTDRELRLSPILPARDPVLKDQVLNGNITHSKHGHVTRKKDPVLNGEHSPLKTGSFFLVT